jgi:two-component system, NtrC family, response regulator AtoC
MASEGLMNEKILVVDDEKMFRMVAESALAGEGYQVGVAANGRTGLDYARTFGPDLIVLDRNLPDLDGLSLIPMFRSEAASRGDDPLIIMATAYGQVENAVQALKAGAYDYLIKPLDLADLLLTIRRALEAKRLRQRAESLSGQSRRRIEREICLGDSVAMKQVMALVDKVATSANTTVLIEGETGTGKELVARLIHARTPGRGEAPFVELNCAAIPETLLESELFGHEKGAFTDAKLTKKGLLEEADAGTLFLDEIGDMPLQVQAKLLRVLETQAFRRLGGNRDFRTDVRFVAATHRDLAAAVEKEAFRLDLFHRLDVFRIRIAPLRERREDILPLARFFLKEHAGRIGRPVGALTSEAEAKLLGYPFPGNVRELRNVIERGVVLESSEALTAEAIILGEPRREPSVSTSWTSTVVDSTMKTQSRPPTLDEMEREYMVRLLDHAKGNRSQVARLMGVSYPTVMKKITDYSIDISRWK